MKAKIFPILSVNSLLKMILYESLKRLLTLTDSNYFSAISKAIFSLLHPFNEIGFNFIETILMEF